jgi:hypothetical protein
MSDWIQLGRSADIASERSERTCRKHHLRHLFYCHVTYHVVITQQWAINTCRTVAWRHLLMRCIALRHTYMRGHEINASTVLLRGACAITCPVVCRPGMPWANLSQYYLPTFILVFLVVSFLLAFQPKIVNITVACRAVARQQLQRKQLYNSVTE